MTRRAVAAAAGSALLLATGGCSTPALVWHPVAPEGSGGIVTLTATSGGVLVGGHDPAASMTSSLQLRRSDGSVQAIPLITGDSDYGKHAELLSVSERDGQVVALGGFRAGAHGNVRWTVWRGGLAGLREQPQPFETFGGWNAGLLTGTAYGARGPAIVGGWIGADNRMNVTAWTSTGARWRRVSVAAVSAASATSLPSAGAVATAGETYVVVGWETELSSEVRDSPVVWTAHDPAGPWTRTALPVPEGAGPTHPTAISCAGERCAVAAIGAAGVAGSDGPAGDQDVWHWRVHVSAQPGAHADAGPPDRIATPLPADTRATVAVAALGDADVVAYGDGSTTRTVTCRDASCSDPTELAGGPAGLAPDGRGGALLAVTRNGRSELWAAGEPR